jgi:type I restriction enzyme R subunit
MMNTTFWHPDGKPISAQEFMELLFGKLPEFFKSEDELRSIWSLPDTRQRLLDGLASKGFGHDQLSEMQKVVDAEKSDIFDVLAYVAYAMQPLTREARANQARGYIQSHFSSRQQAFLDFVLQHYVNEGVHQLNKENLPQLIKLKYFGSIDDAIKELGKPEEIRKIFTGFQRHLYQTVAA